MTAEISFTYGDLRIDKLVKEFYQSILEKCSVCIRAIAGSRCKEIAFHRLLKNPKFSKENMLQQAVIQSQSITKCSKHILCIQDTTEIAFDKGPCKSARGLGILGTKFHRGLLLHPGLLVDANDFSILGISDLVVWTRDEKLKGSVGETKSQERDRNRFTPIEEKESMKWLDVAENTKSRFSHVDQITIIADRESDIYEEWERIPSKKVNLITRCSQNRNLVGNKKLFDKLEEEPKNFCYTIELPEINGKRKKRIAQIEVSYTQVEILKPLKHYDKKAKKSIKLNAILVKEVTKEIPEEERIAWRLLTTHVSSQ
jgi:hypothetical protein